MEAGTINEVEILAAAQRGDKAAFGVLVRQYQRRGESSLEGMMEKGFDARAPGRSTMCSSNVYGAA